MHSESAFKSICTADFPVLFGQVSLTSLFDIDIYFFEVYTKYISSHVLKISEISRVRSTSA